MRWLGLLLAALALGGCFDFGTPLQRTDPRDYLGTEYATWVIEVDTTSGGRPPQAVLDGLRDRLREVVRPNVQVLVDETLPSQPRRWTHDDVLAYSAEHRSRKTGGDTVTTHVLILDGQSALDRDGRRILGAAYGYELVALFPDSIDASCRPLAVPPCTFSRSQVMLPVLVHEFGHILGLVNRGIPMVEPHEASSCGTDAQGNPVPDRGHSSNPDSVMYCAVETSDFLLLLRGGIPDSFDAKDRADLRAAGGR